MRDTLAKMTELQKANAEFQAKCSALGPIAANGSTVQAGKQVAVAGSPTTTTTPLIPKQ